MDVVGEDGWSLLVGFTSIEEVDEQGQDYDCEDDQPLHSSTVSARRLSMCRIHTDQPSYTYDACLTSSRSNQQSTHDSGVMPSLGIGGYHFACAFDGVPRAHTVTARCLGVHASEP